MKKNLEIEENIKKFFEKRNQVQNKSILLLFSKNTDIEKYCEELLNETPEYLNILNVIKSIVYNESFKHCKTCGKLLNFGYKGSFCSKHCRCTNPEVIAKSVKHFHETIKNDKDRAAKVELANLKRKKTCLTKYGVESNFQSLDFKEKNQETSLKKYGVKHPNLCKEVKEKQLSSYHKTMNEHHDEIIGKIKNTIKEKYGEYVWNKNREELRLHDLWKTIRSYSDYVVPLFEEKDVDHLKSAKIYKWKCAKCGNEFESHIHKTMHIPEFPYLPRCLKCFPYLSGFSKKEKELFELVKSYFPDAHKDRSLIRPYELDIVVDELKIAFEFNGRWFHNIDHTYNNFHLTKTKLCNEKGYRLIHIWEDEWNANKNEILFKLDKIFRGEENLNFEDEILKLDRSWYNGIEIPGYEMIEETEPSIVIREGNEVENCGFLIYRKQSDSLNKHI